jgi:transcriptional regulator with XRE-family HTH domain
MAAPIPPPSAQGLATGLWAAPYILCGGFVSHFGDLVKKLRKDKGLTLEAVAKKIGSHKGYVSGIENDPVNPPSVKIIKKYARLLGQDARALARPAWVDKAHSIANRPSKYLSLSISE